MYHRFIAFAEITKKCHKCITAHYKLKGKHSPFFAGACCIQLQMNKEAVKHEVEIRMNYRIFKWLTGGWRCCSVAYTFVIFALIYASVCSVLHHSRRYFHMQRRWCMSLLTCSMSSCYTVTMFHHSWWAKIQRPIGHLLILRHWLQIHVWVVQTNVRSTISFVFSNKLCEKHCIHFIQWILEFCRSLKLKPDPSP